MPLHMRVPKLKGFNNPFRVEYQARQPRHARGVAASTRSRPTTLHATGLVAQGRAGQGARPGRAHPRRCTVKAHAFSKSAEAAITAAGGTVEVLPLPFGDGRPPAKGNALTNR